MAVDQELRTKLIQVVAAARQAVTLIDHHGGRGDGWALIAQIRAGLVDAFNDVHVIERVPCPQNRHEWWRTGGESADCPSCVIETLEAAEESMAARPVGGEGL
jgi:hypothetical protein